MSKNLYGAYFDCHVVRACEIKYTTEGLAIGNFSIAVNDSVKRNGQYEDESSFFECVAYGKVAETLKNFVTSGQRMFFNMRPKQERWVDKEGKKRSRVVFIVTDFAFGEKPRGAQQQNVVQPQNQPQSVQQEQKQFAQQQIFNPAPEDFPPQQDYPPDNNYEIF